jgi:hypothetical protein
MVYHPRMPVTPAPGPGLRPDVIVDFGVTEGLLYVTLRNIGEASAYAVATQFDKPFTGVGGRKPIPALRLFRGVPFMPPGKEFVQLVDTLAAYVRRREPLRLKATVTYRDRHGRRYREVMPHDLAIYRDLGTVTPSR